MNRFLLDLAALSLGGGAVVLLLLLAGGQRPRDLPEALGMLFGGHRKNIAVGLPWLSDRFQYAALGEVFQVKVHR